jgi:hypothetical protein
MNALSLSEEAQAMDRDFDMAFNPFPAELRVFVHGEVLANEGFTKGDNYLGIKTPTALEAVAALQGRWITPDLVSVALAANQEEIGPQLAASIATLPRHASAVVTPTEITDALMEKMRPAPRYRLRWITKPTAGP